jgi:hypothetical protein
VDVGNAVVAVATLLATASLGSGAKAQVGADLNISPKRVALGEGQRSATVYIFNQGDRPATYTVEMIDRTMSENGSISAVPRSAAPASTSALPLVEYTPRVITLQPKQSQSIRIRVRRPEKPGEYRSHLTVTAQPPEDVGLTAVQAAAGTNPSALAVRIVALFSISIPVVVREGAIDSAAAIENPIVSGAAAPGGTQRVALDLVRRGTGSVYGDVEIYAGEGRSERRVGLVRGVAVYPEIQRRSFVTPLTQPVQPGERVRVVYRDDDVHPGTELARVLFVAS